MIEEESSREETCAPEIRVRAEEDGQRVVVTVRGEIDLYSASILDATLSASTPPSHVVIDCGDVRFMDSTGLNALLRHQQRLLEGGGSLRVREPSESVRHVLEVAGLSGLLLDG